MLVMWLQIEHSQLKNRKERFHSRATGSLNIRSVLSNILYVRKVSC